ncbi:taste receptor type 2 member 40-like [Rana temporaria]|uniref:taste receptor type 2 member 40-like n=1 Tax=Rana temporaria TaxID=8407 RepID=UPI001AAD54E6|nr:taste receptor type 2 member 40-like [Rana temporaria]
MIDPNTQTCIIVIALEAISGLCSNSFNIFSLILTSIKERHLASCDCILISLSVSNVCCTIITSTNLLISYVWPSLLRTSNAFYILYYMTLCGMTSSSWLTASLCFFYFIKIQQFQPGILAWVKMKIDKIVPWLIVTAVFLSVSGGFLSLLVSGQELPKNSTKYVFDVNFEQTEILFRTSLIMHSLAFLVGIMSTFSSVWFLKVQRSAGTFGSTKVRDYQSAVQTMVRLVILYAVIYLVLIIHGMEIFPNMSWGYWVCMIILFSFALVQSVLLMIGNPKLREAWRQLFTLRYIPHQ